MHIPELMADGGASRNSYLMQFQADILNIPIQRAADENTTAFGAAILAGLAVGFGRILMKSKNSQNLAEPLSPTWKIQGGPSSIGAGKLLWMLREPIKLKFKREQHARKTEKSFNL